jgi:hypothetical protein
MIHDIEKFQTDTVLITCCVKQTTQGLQRISFVRKKFGQDKVRKMCLCFMITGLSGEVA